MAKATSLRNKEKASYDKELAENTANLAAMTKAIVAIGKGRGGSSTQMSAAEILRRSVISKQSMLNADTGQHSGEHTPASSEIEGTLKQLTDEMAEFQKDLISTEKSAVENYKALMAAKKWRSSLPSRSRSL